MSDKLSGMADALTTDPFNIDGMTADTVQFDYNSKEVVFLAGTTEVRRVGVSGFGCEISAESIEDSLSCGVKIKLPR